MSDSPARASRTLEIAHVLFTDIVGYSKLPMDEQEQLLMQLQEAVRQTSEFSRAEAADELIRLPTGDGMALVFFRDAEAPVRCALELSRVLHNHPDVKLRMGVHSGPVYRVADINANRNVAGGGINIAQRVMDCGDAGHILVSREVAEVIGQLSGWRPTLHDLGEVEVKHGVRIHIYNLYTDGAGSPELPKKISAQREAQSLGVSGAKKKKPTVAILVVTIILVIASVCALLFYPRKAHALTDKDTVVLADFTNTTGDTVFEGTLRQGLSVQLEQSPFLSIISDQQIQQALQMMGQKPNAKLTPEIARELCQRMGSAAVLDGSIAQIGTRYLLTLKAVNCGSGESLASTEAEARDKNHVLDALGKTASDIRNKLGESVSTVQKYNVPLEQATTPSIEALKTYTLAVRTDDDAAAVPLYKHAIELDPEFALAYANLGISYYNVEDLAASGQCLTKAYELRGRASEREQIQITATYYQIVTREIEEAIQAYEAWASMYPRDFRPVATLAVSYGQLGEYQKAVNSGLEALRMKPNSAVVHNNLVHGYLCLNRPADAKAIYEQALARNLEYPPLHQARYQVAFVEGDVSEMERQIEWAKGKPDIERDLLDIHASTELFSGHLRKSEEFFRRAVDLSRRSKEMEAVAGMEVERVWSKVDLGYVDQARPRIQLALSIASTRDVQVRAALALARAGDSTEAKEMVVGLAKDNPHDTLFNGYWLPCILASIEIARNHPHQAIEHLEAASPYELSTVANLYPAYLRGLAFLLMRRGGEAATEFQKILDHAGIVTNNLNGALAHLQIGRAYAMQGDTLKAKAAYQDFLTLWKDADPDIPILIAAKSEYAKLK
jgi:tetratricopeptide (TPR) repeat protein/class 3 adenylate cyclase